MKKSIVVIIVLIAVFLVGFVPQYIKVKHLEKDLSAVRQANDLAELRDLSGLAFIQTSQKNYGLAAATSNQFFTRAGEVANREPDPARRKALEDLLTLQDKITTELAKGDPAVLGDLQVLFDKTRRAASSIGPN